MSDGQTYGFSLDIQSKKDENSCWCNSPSKCICVDHGVIECLPGFIGFDCETTATELPFDDMNAKILNLQYFYFDFDRSQQDLKLSVTGKSAFKIFIKYYYSNSAILPNDFASDYTRTQVTYSQSVIPYLTPSAYYASFPHKDRVIVEIINQVDHISDFQISLNYQTEEELSNMLIIILIVIAVLILVILILAFIFIVRLQRNDRQISEQQRIERMNQRNLKKNKANTTMGDEDIKKFMPAIYYKEVKGNLIKVSKQEDTGTCTVCLCDFEDEEEIRSTYCKHIFHSACLTDWMKKNESCPYCREPLTKVTISELYEKSKDNSLKWLNQVPQGQPNGENNKIIDIRSESKNDSSRKDKEDKLSKEEKQSQKRQSQRELILPPLNQRIIELVGVQITSPQQKLLQIRSGESIDETELNNESRIEQVAETEEIKQNNQSMNGQLCFSGEAPSSNNYNNQDLSTDIVNQTIVLEEADLSLGSHGTNQSVLQNNRRAFHNEYAGGMNKPSRFKIQKVVLQASETSISNSSIK